jgi:hypothetical protein
VTDGRRLTVNWEDPTALASRAREMALAHGTCTCMILA